MKFYPISFLIIFIFFLFSCTPTTCNVKPESYLDKVERKEKEKTMQFLISINDLPQYAKDKGHWQRLKSFSPSDDLNGYTGVSAPSGLEEAYPSLSDGIQRSLIVMNKADKNSWKALLNSECHPYSRFGFREPLSKPHEKFKEMNYKRTVPKEFYLFCTKRQGWNSCHYNALYKNGVFCEHHFEDGMNFPEEFYGQLLDNLEKRVASLNQDTQD